MSDVHPVKVQQTVECGRDVRGLTSLKVHGFDTAEPTRQLVRVRSTSAFRHLQAPDPGAPTIPAPDIHIHVRRPSMSETSAEVKWPPQLSSHLHRRRGRTE
jgi:hypothetical protein